jgi:hypothetical protein
MIMTDDFMTPPRAGLDYIDSDTQDTREDTVENPTPADQMIPYHQTLPLENNSPWTLKSTVPNGN